MQDEEANKIFNVQLASIGKRDIECINQLSLKSPITIEDVTHTDILIIPTIGVQLDKVLSNNRNLQPIIQGFHEQGADMASNGSGVFFSRGGCSNMAREPLATSH